MYSKINVKLAENQQTTEIAYELLQSLKRNICEFTLDRFLKKVIKKLTILGRQRKNNAVFKSNFEYIKFYHYIMKLHDKVKIFENLFQD